MLNDVCIMGRLTATPELRITTNEVSVCSFTIACNRPKRGGEEPPPDFIDCVAWRKTAEFVSKWFEKGDLIVVRGSLQTRTYEDQSGNRRKATELRADEIHFTGAKKQSNSDAEAFEETDETLPF